MTTEPVQVKLQYVLEKYGIRVRDNFKFSFFSMANEVFFLTDQKGRKFVLKNCLKNRTKELLSVEAEVCRHLNAHDCGAPEVVPALDGSPVVEYNGDVWMMYAHLKGKTPTWSRPLRFWHLRGSITGLARYHRAVSTLDPALDTGRIRSYDYERITAWLEDLKSQLAADTSGRASVEKMRPLVDQYLDLARGLPSLYPSDQIERCEKLMIHGDFHAFNIMFRWFRFSSCYDFDFIRRDTKLPDVLWTLQFYQRYLYRKRFGNKVWQQGFQPDLEAVRGVETTALGQFVKLYNKTYRLTREEVALLPGMRHSLALYNVRFFSLKNSEEECLEHFGWFEWQWQNLQRTDEVYRQVVADVLKDWP